MDAATWQAFYDAVYARLSVEASLVVAEGEPPVLLRVIDSSKGVDISTLSGVEVQTMRPGAWVRVSEIAERGLYRDHLRGGRITFNDNEWTIHSHFLNPSPAGGGEILLVLKDDE